MSVIINFPYNNKRRKYVCRSLALQEEVFEKYLSLLKEISEQAVMSGATHDAIVHLYDNAYKIFKVSDGLYNLIEADSNKFHKRIDDIDLHIYG